ncbi:MAG TPA: HipA N-terminal domain-containing protein [Chlamydiales bacterium]|nr:HipA N-terminal domain-containing protein [Chlamydiales bacterium]
MSQQDRNAIIGIQVFLELKSSRIFVGTLKKIQDKSKKDSFYFEYHQNYLKHRQAIALGPEMPLTRRTFHSDSLFIPFVERIPSRDNPAYGEYCQATGISLNEADPFIVLSTIAHRGPSSFIFEPLYDDTFTSEDFIRFRKTLNLSVKEFATLFGFSTAAVTRTELMQSSGREVLKRAALYARYPKIVLDLLKEHGGFLHSRKQEKIEQWLCEQMRM